MIDGNLMEKFPPDNKIKQHRVITNNSIDTVSIENKILIIWGLCCFRKELLYFDKSFLLIKACSFQNTTRQRNNFIFRGFCYVVSVYLWKLTFYFSFSANQRRNIRVYTRLKLEIHNTTFPRLSQKNKIKMWNVEKSRY